MIVSVCHALLFKKYYLPGDVHYNKEGNTLIADKFLKTYLNQE